LEFNQSEERKSNLKFSELCFDWSKSNSISIPISSLIRALAWILMQTLALWHRALIG